MQRFLFGLDGVIPELETHFVIKILVAIILVSLGYFGRRVADLSAWLVSVRVHGKWKTKLTKDRKDGHGLKEEDHESAKLHQFFYTVWGTTKTNTNRVYKVKGRLSGNRLTLLYREVSGGSDSGAIFLEVHAGGDKMIGTEVGCNIDTNEPDVFPYKWHRPPKD
jgi:hypothetical protein